MTTRICASLLALLPLATASAASAQDAALAAPPPRALVDNSPYMPRGSATGEVGSAVRWPLPGGFAVEGETGYKQMEMKALQSSVSLTYDLPPIGPVTPYVAAGLGLDRYIYPGSVDISRLTLKSAHTLAANAGVGLRFNAGDGWAFRSDLRRSKGVSGNVAERWRFFNALSVAK